MSSRVHDILKRSQKSWLVLAQAAVWIFAIIAGFVRPPPDVASEETKAWVRFAQFVVVIVLGLVLLAAMRWQYKRHAFTWGAAAALCLLLGTASFFGYQYCLDQWTARYNTQRVVIGGSYTKDAQTYLEGKRKQENRESIPPAEMIMDFNGEVEEIWVPSSILKHRFLLAAMYVLAMPLMTVCIMALLQAIHCASIERKPKKSRPIPARRTSDQA